MPNTIDSSDIQGLEEITPKILEYIDLTNNVKTAKEQIKLLNERRKELEVGIHEKMKQHDIKAFTTSQGNVRIFSSRSQKAPSKDEVAELIAEKVGNDQLAQEVLGIIYDKANRPSTSTEKIKVIPRRGGA